jgi:hypothetical protein
VHETTVIVAQDDDLLCVGHQAAHRSSLPYSKQTLESAEICCDLVGPVEYFCVDPVALNQPVNSISAEPTAFVTADRQHVELSDKVPENDGVLSWY